MQKYLKLISHFLQKEEDCLLPGIGILRFKTESAREDRENNRIHPPFSSILLEKEESASVPYHNIIQLIKAHFHLSEKEAQAAWDKTRDAIKVQVESGAPVVIPGTGTLQYNDLKQLEFAELPSAVSLYEAVPYHFENEPPIADPYAEAALPYETERRGKQTAWFLLLGIVALLVIGYFAYRYFFFPPSNEIQKDPAITPTERTGPPLSSTPSADSANPRTTAFHGNNTSDSIHFAVIYAVYHSRQKAEQHYKRMRNWGHEVSLFTKDSVTYQLGYAYYALPKDTADRLSEIQKIYGGHPFLIYPGK